MADRSRATVDVVTEGGDTAALDSTYDDGKTFPPTRRRWSAPRDGVAGTADIDSGDNGDSDRGVQEVDIDRTNRPAHEQPIREAPAVDTSAVVDTRAPAPTTGAPANPPPLRSAPPGTDGHSTAPSDGLPPDVQLPDERQHAAEGSTV